jgi:hypothetical protein
VREVAESTYHSTLLSGAAIAILSLLLLVNLQDIEPFVILREVEESTRSVIPQIDWLM